MQNKTWSVRIVLLCAALIAVLGTIIVFVKNTFFAGPLLKTSDPNMATDVGRLNETRVARTVRVGTEEDVREALAAAQAEGLHVSVAGQQHSMGGHTLFPNGVLLDMRGYNRVIDVQPEARTVRVESGATWNDVIRAVNPHNLSVPVLQDYSNFTVGGSLSVNIHQSDPNYGSMMETVRSFTLLMSSGEVRRVSRTENPELFELVNGGYGLFGVVLEVELALTENHVYEKQESVLTYTDYNDHFDTILEDPEVENVFARLSIVPDETLLRDMVVTTYRIADAEVPAPSMALEKDAVWLKKLFFDLSRASTAGKELRWYMQTEHSDRAEPPVITRNNLDYNDASFLEYYSEHDTDILQEYFFPRAELVPFLDTLRKVVQEENINLLSATVRYIPPRPEGFLTFAHPTEERFAVVLYLNVGRSAEEQAQVTAWTRTLIDAAVALDGTYYLPYGLYASDDQLRAAYPRIDAFFAKKRAYDPEELLMNKFYARYAKAGQE